jgi:hypothetical protein
MFFWQVARPHQHLGAGLSYRVRSPEEDSVFIVMRGYTIERGHDEEEIGWRLKYSMYGRWGAFLNEVHRCG